MFRRFSILTMMAMVMVPATALLQTPGDLVRYELPAAVTFPEGVATIPPSESPTPRAR